VNEPQPVCAVVGAGPGNGVAFARRLAQAGYQVALLARDLDRLTELSREIPSAHPFACDATDEASLTATFCAIADKLGPVSVLVYNVGKGVWGAPLDVAPEDFERSWRSNCLGGFLAARQVLPAMREAARGTILFVGATASLRGKAETTAFAAAKAAQRSLAQSLARAYGPDGVHVALLIIDAVVDEPLMRARFADRPDSFFCKPDAIAEAALMLVRQDPSAWTFELDLRPFGERW